MVSEAAFLLYSWVCPWRRLLEDLEEVQTDKVSMEYLLREKLERLVQSEIEARVARMHQVKPLLNGFARSSQESLCTL